MKTGDSFHLVYQHPTRGKLYLTIGLCFDDKPGRHTTWRILGARATTTTLTDGDQLSIHAPDGSFLEQFEHTSDIRLSTTGSADVFALMNGGAVSIFTLTIVNKELGTGGVQFITSHEGVTYALCYRDKRRKWTAGGPDNSLAILPLSPDTKDLATFHLESTTAVSVPPGELNTIIDLSGQIQMGKYLDEFKGPLEHGETLIMGRNMWVTCEDIPASTTSWLPFLLILFFLAAIIIAVVVSRRRR